MSEQKNYYVFQYVYDPVNEAFTSIEGDVVGYVKADDPFDACEKLGFKDPNQYFAKVVEKIEEHDKIIKDEIGKLKKLQGQLKPMIDEKQGAEEDFKKNRPCPNCGKKMDKNYKCSNPECGFGHEKERAIKEIKKQLKKAKAAKAPEATKKECGCDEDCDGEDCGDDCKCGKC